MNAAIVIAGIGLVGALGWTSASAQPVNTGSAAGNSKEFYDCGVTPCVGGVPPAAPGGAGGTGPGAIRTAPRDSPVGTGVGGGTSGGASAGGTKGSGGVGGSSAGGGSSP